MLRRLLSLVGMKIPLLALKALGSRRHHSAGSSLPRVIRSAGWLGIALCVPDRVTDNNKFAYQVDLEWLPGNLPVEGLDLLGQ